MGNDVVYAVNLTGVAAETTYAFNVNDMYFLPSPPNNGGIYSGTNCVFTGNAVNCDDNTKLTGCYEVNDPKGSQYKDIYCQSNDVNKEQVRQALARRGVKTYQETPATSFSNNWWIFLVVLIIVLILMFALNKQK